MKLPPLLGTSSLICEASMKLPPLLGLVALIRHSGADPCRFLGSPLERSATRSTCVRGSNGSWIRLRFLLAVMTGTMQCWLVSNMELKPVKMFPNGFKSSGLALGHGVLMTR